MNLPTTLTTAAAATLLIVGSSSWAPLTAAQPAAAAHQSLPTWATHECRTTSSVNCRWDAAEHKGRGHDHLVREFPGSADMVCVMYVARSLGGRDYCEATR